MAASQIITQGIGPPSSSSQIFWFLTQGLESGLVAAGVADYILFALDDPTKRAYGIDTATYRAGGLDDPTLRVEGVD